MKVIVVLIAVVSFCPVSVWSVGTKTNVAEKGASGYLGRFYEKDETRGVEKGKTETPSVFGVIVKTVLILGLLLFAVWVIFKLVFRGTSLPTAGDLGVIDVVASKHIGFGNYIQIIKVGGDFYIVGFSSSGGISVVEKIENDDVVNEIKVAFSRLKTQEKPVSFWSVLIQHFKGENLPSRNPISFLEHQKDKLRKMK